MAKNKLPSRLPPKRTITKQQAIRHLIHAAARMIAAREDPFAIHLLIQSADKLLIDLAKKRGQKLLFDWGQFAKPEYKKAVIEAIRETYNFLKHADKDHADRLHVASIARANILHLALCTLNYRELFGGWTDHMKLLFNVAKFVFPDALVHADQRSQFDAILPEQDFTLAEFLSIWWDNPGLITVTPNLASEKAEDLQDTQPLYSTKVKDIQQE